jgi:ABC-2 type transport system permease protein
LHPVLLLPARANENQNRPPQPPVEKYWHIIGIGIQNTLVYRVNFLFRATFGLIPLTATILLWKTIYAGKTDSAQIDAYSLSEMISYYLLITIVDALTSVTEDDWQIAADIKDGNISQFLLKPIDYLGYRLCLFLSGRLIYTAIAIIPVTAFILLQREHFVLPPTLGAFAWFLVSLCLTALLQFFMSYTMALLAFWVLEVATFIFIAFAFEYLAGGHLFPLDILTPAVAALLNWLPFPYLCFFPINVYMGKTNGAALAQGLAIQAAWVIITYTLARLVWNRGIQKYSAVGG